MRSPRYRVIINGTSSAAMTPAYFSHSHSNELTGRGDGCQLCDDLKSIVVSSNVSNAITGRPLNYHRDQCSQVDCVEEKDAEAHPS